MRKHKSIGCICKPIHGIVHLTPGILHSARVSNLVECRNVCPSRNVPKFPVKQRQEIPRLDQTVRVSRAHHLSHSLLRVQTNRINLTNLQTNILIDLSIREPIVGIGEDVRHPDVLPLVLAVFTQPLPRNHDWHGGLSDQVVTEGSKQDTVTVSIMRDGHIRTDLPFQCVAAS
jgi:hypothetical protein